MLDPGKFASLPPAVSLHTTDGVPKEQSTVAVKSVFGSDMSILYVDGPNTIVSFGKIPQSVDGGQAIAIVVALASAATTEAEKSVASWPMMGTLMTDWSAEARPSRANKMIWEYMVRRID